MMPSGSQRSRSDSSSSRGTWWEVVEIVEEDAGKGYRVRWAGKDPKTGKPWPLDWVPNSDCSSDLIKHWEKKKAKKQEPLPSGSVSTSQMTTVAFKRPPGKRNAAATSELVRPTRKRKHPTPPGSPGNTDEDSAPSRRKRLVTAIGSTPDGGGQSTAPPDRNDHEASSSLPPLEEIELWVPIPNAKFGPPKRRRTTGERLGPLKEGPINTADSEKTSVQTSVPLPSSPRPLILSESQIIALREEEEESQSQSQSTSNQPGGSVEDPTTSDSLQPTRTDAKGATQVSKDSPLDSLKGLIGRSSTDIQLTNPNVNNGHVPGPNSQAGHLQSTDTNTSKHGENVTEAPKGLSLLPAAPHISLVNLNPSSSAIMSLESPQMEMPTKSSSPQKGKPGLSSIQQRSPSRREPPRSASGMLAERRAFEARVRLDELRRAGASFGNHLKGHMTSMTPQSSRQPPPHVVLKQLVDGMESPSQSQNTHLGKSGNEILGNASSSGNRRAEPLVEPEEDLVINKSGQGATVGSLPRKDALAPNVIVLGSEDEVPPTASNSTQSQSNDGLPNTSLGSQLAAALDLLHKKSEEISELRAQVVILRTQSTDDEASLMHKQAGNGALHGKEGADHLATGVQTDHDDEAHAAWNSECTRWAEEKLALQREAEALRGEKVRAVADVDFFREQYQRASAFASTTRSENEELSARATLVESQVVHGVALVRSTFEARVTKLEAEVRKYKALSEMLTERARRTDDNVRYRAARALEMDVELRDLRGEYREMEAELEETIDELRAKKRANARLRRRVASLESKEQAADVGTSTLQELTVGGDENGDEDYRPPSSSPRGGSDGSPPRHFSPRDDDDAGPTDGEIQELTYLGESAQSSNDDMVYLCRWRSGEPAGCCDAVVNTKEELHEHVLSHHLACHPNPSQS